MISLKFRTAMAAAATALAFSLSGGGATAATIVETITGNDCSGVWGSGFSACKTSETYDSSPIIAKFDLNDAGTAVTATSLNTGVFPTIDGSEFTLSFSGDTATWSYARAIDDPVITVVTVKAGNKFDVWYNDGAGIFSGSYTTSDFKTISHIAFWDSGSDVVCGPEDPFYNPDTGFCSGDTGKVPVPAGLPLMLTAMGIGAYMRKRARKSA
jgi:hypothetical protein